MEEKINKINSENSKSDTDQKSQINKGSDNSKDMNVDKTHVIDSYREILNNKKQRMNYNNSTGAIIVCIIILLAVCFNIYIVEYEKYETRKITETQGAIAAELQAKLDKIKEEIARKNKDSADIISFNDQYMKIRQDFYLKVEEISKDINSQVNSLDDIKQLTAGRIKLAKDYKNQLNSLKFPGVLENFYKYETAFIDSDINLWTIINSYYNIDDFSKFDLNKIDEETLKSHELYLKAQEELKSVYNKYELSYFLKDLLF